MGTDITMMVEGFAGGAWRPLNRRDMWPDERREKLFRVPVLLRNYELFSILADVRNHSGRGSKSMRMLTDPDTGREFEWEYDTDDGGHDPLIPISAPKGIPDDATEDWREFLAEGERRKMVFHDHSFLTIGELRSGQWDQVVYRQAILTEEEYLALTLVGIKPTQLARGAGGEGVRVVNEVEYAAGIRGESTTAVDARWREGPLTECTPTFQIMMDAMDMAAKEVLEGPESIRVLFAFDS